MLSLTIKAREFWNPITETFDVSKEYQVQLEHSLIAISKWESKWHKPFLNSDKTDDEIVDYIRCMSLNKNTPNIAFLALDNDNIKEIRDYISDPMTATWFSKNSQTKKSREVITSELIYYWMIKFGVPFECEKWHINRLLTLIRVCSEKESPPKKMTKQQLMSRNKALNAARRKRLGTRG